MQPLTIAILQAELAWHDAAANRDAFAKRIDALSGQAQLVVLPEMFTTGFTMDAPGQAETMAGPSVAWLCKTAKNASAAVCGSLVIEEDGRYYNRFVLAQPDGRLAATYDKRHLFRLAGEGEHYAVGEDLVTVAVGGWRVRPMVCYDLRFPVWSRRRSDDDFELLLYVANWPSPRHHAWETLLRARAIENQCYVAGVNRVGRDGNDVPYAGGSAVVDYLGQDIVNLGDRADSAVVTLDPEALAKFRDRFPFAADADDFEIRPRLPGS